MVTFDPYVGYSPAGNVPAYYNPYTNYQGPQQQPGQQLGQQVVPGKDAATPGSRHGSKGQRVRMISPKGTMNEVPLEQVPYWERKGARRV